jgi:hypothetical protein
MSISNSYPTQKATLNLDFANSGKLDSRISYSRSSTGTYLSNERHKASENLVTQSDASDWIFSSADYTKTASQSGPDGSTNATKFTEKANGSEQYQLQSNDFTPIANQEITYSVWLKQTSGSRNYQQLRVGNIGANQAFATFNLSNGTVDQTGGTLGVSASVNAGPTGWYQCVLRFTPTSSTALAFYIYAASASGGELPNVTGDTGNSFTLFGAQASTLGETVVNETSGQIHREFAPTLKTAAADEPRFEYAADGQSAAGSPLGLLVESQVSNLVPYSENFGTWGDTNVVAEAGAAVGPDGQPCYVMREDSSSGVSHYLSQNASGQLTSTTYTMSVYAKKVATSNQTRYLRLRVNGIGGQASVEYDLSNGTVNRATGTSLDSSSISSIGNGWYRLVMTYTNPSGSVASGMIISGSPDTTSTLPTYDGDDYSAFALFGASVEQSSSVSSYIKSNSGSSTTRSADSCSVADFGYTGGPVSVVSETSGGSGSFPGCWVIKNSTGSEALQLYKQSAAATEATDFRVYANSGGTNTVDTLITSSASAGKIAVSYGTNDVAFTASGNAVQTDTSASSIGAVDTLIIGAITTTNQLNGHIKRVALYNVALSDTELQAITS